MTKLGDLNCEKRLCVRASCSPSPQPSPSGRGGALAWAFANLERLDFLIDRLRFSLSLREWVGVRGKCTFNILSGRTVEGREGSRALKRNWNWGFGIFLGFGFWDLGFLWSLALGAWSFRSPLKLSLEERV